MSERVFPTKANLISARKSLELAKLGYDLMDRKRNILIREMMALISKAGEVQEKIGVTYSSAYRALQRANVTLGMCEEFAGTTPVDDGLKIDYRSVMGVELPTVTLEESPVDFFYGWSGTNSQLDKAYLSFVEVKKLTAELAEVESSVYKLAEAIKKTQKRANALSNVMIPRLTETIKYITEALEEKEREDFSRLKVIKAQKDNK